MVVVLGLLIVTAVLTLSAVVVLPRPARKSR